ncbi:MAG: hypothetical protein JW750_06410 [Anaerolineaceae bacterium]|nr:hypothetical protein [Anaerolineaceae bacterium]
MNLDAMRLDSAIKQKKGLHFILASIIIWGAVLAVHSTSMPILTKNLFTFCFTAPLLPLAFMISKLIKVDFTNKENPLTNLGVIFSVNQMLYLLIAMWIYNAVPEKMVMVLAIIFGAHLLPYGWLYQSKTYMALSVIIPIAVLIVGLQQPPAVVAGLMMGCEVIFSALLVLEVRKLPASSEAS